MNWGILCSPDVNDIVIETVISMSFSNYNITFFFNFVSLFCKNYISELC